MSRITSEEINAMINNVIIENEEYVILDEEQFNKINNLYKFRKISNTYFDKKRQRTIATRFKSLFEDNTYKYRFSFNWLKKELLSTGSKTLLEIVSLDPNLQEIKEIYTKKLKKDKHYLPLNDFRALNFIDEDKNDEEFEEVY